ncbi:hypothetical protein BDZ97DRAFT_1763398 [Flammula alnicola]|nr:hypothetical protein BDZ97DRAFT_1763398 [Flammula alnicola]
MSLLNCLACMRARGLALDLLEWVNCNYELRRSADVFDMHTVFATCMNRLCVSLMLYKQLAENQSIEGAPNCTVEAIGRQLQGIFPDDHYLQVGIEQAIVEIFTSDEYDSSAESMSLDVDLDENFSIHRLDPPAKQSGVDLKSAGISERDRLYMAHMKIDYASMTVKREPADKRDIRTSDSGEEDEENEEVEDE